jgi:hypothetical protein
MVIAQAPAAASPVPPCGDGDYQEAWVMYGQPRWGNHHTEVEINDTSNVVTRRFDAV